MARPTDWDVLDLDHDPTPGDPQRVKDIGGLMRGIGDDAERAARDVRGLAGDDAVMGWIGASGDAFMAHIGKFPSQLDKVADSHHLCADALLEFGATLDSVQSQADRALVQARPLHDQVQRLQTQLASAHTDLTSAGKGVTAAQAAATVDPTSVQHAIRTQTTAQSAVDSLNSQLSGPASQLEALKKLAASAESLRHTAEDTARTKIDTATDAGIPPDSFWHKLGHLAGELWHGLVIVAEIVSFVGALVLMVVGGPLWLIVAVVAAGVIILADTLYKYSQGKASLWDVGLAVLSCIPITKGFTSMAAVADAFRAGGMLGAGLHIAGALGGGAKDLLGGMAALLKGGGGDVIRLLRDGAEIRKLKPDLLMNMSEVTRVAEKYGIDLGDVKIVFDKVNRGMSFGETTSADKIILRVEAFRKGFETVRNSTEQVYLTGEGRLARTLYHEMVHVGDLKASSFPATAKELLKWEDKAWEAETNWWNDIGKAIHDGGNG
jgi:hypothetical protein